jgi:hypothetical protein
VYCRKVAKNFGQCIFFSTRRRTMNGFVLYLPVCFALRCRVVGLHPKSKKLSSLRGIRRQAHAYAKIDYNQPQNQRPLTTKDTKSTEKSKTTISCRFGVLLFGAATLSRRSQYSTPASAKAALSGGPGMGSSGVDWGQMGSKPGGGGGVANRNVGPSVHRKP